MSEQQSSAADLLATTHVPQECPKHPGWHLYNTSFGGEDDATEELHCPACLAMEVAELQRENAALRHRIKELERDLAVAKEPWDDGETVWEVPTAWAYAQTCKVVNGRQMSAEKRLEKNEAKLAEAEADRDGLMAAAQGVLFQLGLNSGHIQANDEALLIMRSALAKADAARSAAKP